MKTCYTRHTNMLKFMATGFKVFFNTVSTTVDYSFPSDNLKKFLRIMAAIFLSKDQTPFHGYFSMLQPSILRCTRFLSPSQWDLYASLLLMVETLDQDKLPSFHPINSIFRSQVKNHSLKACSALSLGHRPYYRLGFVLHPLLTFCINL